jgi:2-desacetyl-2-hydroxyethyl bacteriochlorophyllide A dehydrogenase
MKQLTCTEPGNFAYSEISKPFPGKGETLLRIHRVGICGTDLHAYEGTQPYFSYPRILGHELAAEIVSTDAPGFAAGEAVTVIPYFHCGTCIACLSGKPNCCAKLQVLGVHIDGAMSEYITVPSYSLVKSGGLDYDELALVEPLAIGAHGVRRAAIQKDEYTLIIGAGPIGLGTMEFARIAGGKVIAMDVQENRLYFCKTQLQVPYVINAKEEQVQDRLLEITNGHMPTVVVDATGNLTAINTAFQYLAHSGRYVLVGLQKGEILVSHPEFHKREATLMSSRNATREDFMHVMNSMQKGELRPANYITHRVSFHQVKDQFSSWLDPANAVIKAMVSF